MTVTTPIETLLRTGTVRTVFQPIVDLDTGAVLAHEALTRGPAGALHDPLALLAAARREGLLPELDDACRASAVHAALIQQRSATTLFLNAEPEAFTAVPGAAWENLAAVIAAAVPHLHVVLEVTERDIPTRPATLLRTVDRIRELGWGIALDDVGASSASLAFMPLLRPDVVKLDAALVQHRPSAQTGQVMHAVNDYAERHGALVLAEGIETHQHLDTAHALGARLGQGWLFGHPHEQLATDRPAARRGGDATGKDTAAGHAAGHGVIGERGHLHRLLDRRAASRRPPARIAPHDAPHDAAHDATPFTTLASEVVLRRASKALLMQLSTQLEEQAVRAGAACILTSAFQHARHFTTVTAARYEKVAEQAGFVYAVGEAFADVDVPGVHAGNLDVSDPLCREWDVAVIGPHFHAALLAREVDDAPENAPQNTSQNTSDGSGPDLERVFEYAVTYRYDTVVAAVRDLLLRVAEHATDHP